MGGVFEGRGDLVELVDPVDRQLQLAQFHGGTDVLADLVKKNLADAGAEGDASSIDAVRGVQVEIEFGAGAAKTADIADSPPN
jgi:hypothetical protein